MADDEKVDAYQVTKTYPTGIDDFNIRVKIEGVSRDYLRLLSFSDDQISARRFDFQSIDFSNSISQCMLSALPYPSNESFRDALRRLKLMIEEFTGKIFRFDPTLDGHISNTLILLNYNLGKNKPNIVSSAHLDVGIISDHIHWVKFRVKVIDYYDRRRMQDFVTVFGSVSMWENFAMDFLDELNSFLAYLDICDIDAKEPLEVNLPDLVPTKPKNG